MEINGVKADISFAKRFIRLTLLNARTDGPRPSSDLPDGGELPLRSVSGGSSEYRSGRAEWKLIVMLSVSGAVEDDTVNRYGTV